MPRRVAPVRVRVRFDSSGGTLASVHVPDDLPQSPTPAGQLVRRDGLAASVPAVVALVLIGLALGTVNVLSNYGHTPAAEHVSKVVGNDWAWLTAGYLSARTATSRRSAFTRSALVLYPAVLIYYPLDWMFITQTLPEAQIPPAGFIIEAIIWMIVATFTAAGLALLAVLARRSGGVGTLADMAVPAFIAWTAYRSHRFQVEIPQGADPVLRDVTGVLWPTALLVVVGVAFGGLWRRLQPS